MGMAPQLITESLYNKALNQLKNMSKDNRVAIRLRAIVSAKEHGVAITAKVFNITTNTLRTWVRSFNNGGVNDLEYKYGRGRRSRLQEQHYKTIEGWIVEDCNLTIRQILNKLEETFNLNSSKSAVHRVLKKLKFSYITPRPQHYKQDKDQQADFKKKSKNND